jgi:1-acyl-sn-glycerol-3-phosphate acyltransferase
LGNEKSVMIEKLRTGFVLASLATSTLVLALSQVVVLKTGFGNPFLLPRLWHGRVLKALGLRVRVVGALSARRPLMIASNHVSWTDIGVLGSMADLSFIAKSDMQGWPLMGWLSTLQRTVFVERERRRRSGAQAGEIALRLKQGDVMVLFPEGTTDDGNGTLPFKSALFGAATMVVGKGAIGPGGAGEVAIQPVSIAYVGRHGMPVGRAGRMALSWIGDQDLAPHLASLMEAGPIDVEVRFGEPVIFSAQSDRKETARLVEARVQAMLHASLRGTEPER